MKRVIGLCLMLCMCFAVMATQVRCDPGETKRFRLVWDANSEQDLAGYRVYRSQTSDMAVWVREGSDILEPLTYWVIPSNFPVNVYVAITAYDTTGNESEFSNSVMYDKDQNSPSAPGSTSIEEIASAELMMLPDGREIMRVDVAFAELISSWL